jgi:hypothetical protein
MKCTVRLVKRAYGEDRCVKVCDGGRLRERNHLKDLCIEGRIILQWILKKWDGE